MENELATVLKYVGLSEKDASNLAVSYAKSNIFQLYEWQKDCIRSTNVNQGLNLVYCAPTGGGKTMVAEFIIFRSVCGLNKKAIFVLPFVSLVVEKVDYFKKLLRSYNSKCISDYDKVQVFCVLKKESLNIYIFRIVFILWLWCRCVAYMVTNRYVVCSRSCTERTNPEQVELYLYAQ